MQFLDLNTGYTFDALWNDNQTNGYTFWFPNEQSIRLTYVMPICICTDSSEPIELNIEENPIFSFITHSTEDTEHGGFIFKEPVHSYEFITEPETINDTTVHKFYVSCKSDDAGEFTTFIDIKGHGRIKIGADFYGEYEPVYINLSNFGVEIPEYIQKAIYDSNVHEDYKDNILINRKFKELLSNYWELVANRGSYKSLLNTLSWFEWGDILRIREIWKRNTAGKNIYDDRELCSLLENKYQDSLGSFVKTAYISLYANFYKTTDNYDAEENPVFENIALKWGKEDLALKLSLLSQFFSTFFMPIHMSILHACVEDIVYTNTIKSVVGTSVCRTDTIGDLNYVSCNISDTDEFRISNVRAQVTEDTVFKTDYVQTNVTIGVDEFPDNGELDEDSIYNFAGQYYTGPGAIIPIEFTLAEQLPRDYIKYTSIDFIPDNHFLKINEPTSQNSLKFNGIDLYPNAISNILFEVEDYNSIWYKSNVNKFVATKIPTPYNIYTVISGSDHMLWRIDESEKADHEWENYAIAYSDDYKKFMRCDSRSLTLYPNSKVPDEYIYENATSNYYIDTNSNIYIWDKEYRYVLTKTDSITPIHSYKFKLNDGITSYHYKYNYSTEQYFKFNNTYYVYENSKLVEYKPVYTLAKKEKQKFIFNDRFYANNGNITVKFNLLVKEARDYVLDFMFITASSKTITRKVKLKVLDTDNLHIQLYKVQAKDDSLGFTYDDWNNMEYNDYFFRIQPNDPDAKQYYSQYLPYMHYSNELYPNHKGIKLNRTVIVDMRNKNGHGKIYNYAEIAKLRGFMDNDFLEFDRRELLLDANGNPQLDENGNRMYGPITYTIWVSKKFDAEVPQIILDDKYNIIRNSLGFYPQFHTLVPMNGNNIDDYTVNQYEAVCCAAEIRNTSRTTPIPFRYGHLIEDAEWSFENATTLEKFNHELSVRQPFVADKKYEVMPDGYYDVVFRYKLVDSEPRELRLNSAFRKKSI